MKKKLPIGIQTFRDIRDTTENYMYIDKTDIAYKLITSGKYFFLSRPRRFGKSLFLDTLSEIFNGSQHLFKGLAIHDMWNWEQKFPIIRISFAVGDFSIKQGINDRINFLLESTCKQNKIDFPEKYKNQCGNLLEAIIYELYTKYNQKVVVLIDEYDKPILDSIHLENKTTSTEARDKLREFYSALKSSDAYLKFVFITGVSKFSKLNLFSGLNNITDITIDSAYATITGYTHADVEREFAEHLVGIDLNEVKRWYNGYNYFGEPIYNPYDILLFIDKQCTFANYWWQTGNPSFLIEILKKGKYYLPELENYEATEETLNAFDVEYIDIVALLWQTGYLTFDKKEILNGKIIYKLKIPNFEIQTSLNTLFAANITNLGSALTKPQILITKALLSNNLNDVKKHLNSLFASIPYTNFTKSSLFQYEGYYASIIFAFFASLGFDVVPEDITNIGRIDMTLKSSDSIFIFEFKVDTPVEAAIYQIKNNRYFEKYTHLKLPIYLIGIQFDSTKRNIENFEWEKFELCSYG